LISSARAFNNLARAASVAVEDGYIIDFVGTHLLNQN